MTVRGRKDQRRREDAMRTAAFVFLFLSLNVRAGVIDTVAGTGKPGYAGDRGPATSALLNQPFHCDLDGKGALYVADALNHCVRKIGRAHV